VRYEKEKKKKAWNKAHRTDSRGRQKGDGGHLRLYHYVLESLAWRSLSGATVKVILEICCRHHGSNNGEISFAVRDGKDLGLCIETTCKALWEAQAKGFLEVTGRSTFATKTGEASTYRVTFLDLPIGSSERDKRHTDEFRQWTPGNDFPINKGGGSQRKTQIGNSDLSDRKSRSTTVPDGPHSSEKPPCEGNCDTTDRSESQITYISTTAKQGTKSDGRRRHD
jgi:hypothetical protein